MAKFILQESDKFILLEAATSDIILNNINDIKIAIGENGNTLATKITEIKNKNESGISKINKIEDAITNLSNIYKEADNTAKSTSGALDETKSVLTTKFIPLVDNIITELENRFAKLKDATEFKDFKKSANEFKAAATSLTDEAKLPDTLVAAKKIVSVLDTADKVIFSRNLGKLLDTKNNLTELCDTCLNLLGKVNKYLLTNNIAAVEEDILEEYLNKLNAFYKAATAVLNLKSDAKSITTEKIPALKTLQETLIALAESTSSIKTSDGGRTDWNQKLKELGRNASASGKDVEKFWDDYFEQEWGSKKAKVRNLGFGFMNELKNLGLNPRLNPIIPYLKEKIDLVENGKINHDKWVAIHNAIVKDILTPDDFNKQDGRFGPYNIIFNDKLFDMSGAEISDYLVEQNNAWSIRYNTTFSDRFKDKVEGGNVIANVMYTAGDKDNLGAKLNPSIDYDFRTLSNIQELIRKFGEGKTIKDKVPASTQLVKNILDELTGHKDHAEKYLYYLRIIWQYTYSKQFNAVEADCDPKFDVALKDVGLKGGDPAIIHSKLKLDNVIYAPDQVKQLIEGLAKIIGILKEK